LPKIDISKAAVRTKSAYPGALGKITDGREKTVLGDIAGLTQFGVNLTRLKPGAASAHRHWHETEDEFVYILEGEAVLIENGGETILHPGDAAGFKANDSNAHCLVNKSQRDVLYVEIGTRAAIDRYHYPDVDLAGEKTASGVRFWAKSSGVP
jgi:uncharacterized cupin superfamily protein